MYTNKDKQITKQFYSKMESELNKVLWLERFYLAIKAYKKQKNMMLADVFDQFNADNIAKVLSSTNFIKMLQEFKVI